MAESRRRETGDGWISADEAPSSESVSEESLEEEEQDQEPEPEAEEFMAFDRRYRQPFEGLLYIGKLTAQVSLLGHTFLVKTMTTSEKLKVLEVAKRWEDTSLGYQLAYKAAVVAGALLLVDGRELLKALNTVDPIEQQFEYLVRVWHPLAIDYVYRHVDALEGQVLKIMEELGVDPEPRLVSIRDPRDVTTTTETAGAGATLG